MFFFSTGYLGILSSFIACTFSIPSIVYVGGDWSDLIKHKSLKKNAFKRFMLLRYSEFIRLIQDYSRNSADIRLIRGNELFTRYKKENSYKLPPMTNIRRRDIKKIDDLTIVHGDKSKILFVGRMETENGINDFVEACGIIKSSQKTPFEMNIVGQGPLFKSVKERVSQLNLEANFLGYIENGQKLIDVYRKNQILVIPVLRAGLPRVLIEGFSQGLAIVASETGGIPHLVSDGDNGLLFKAGDYKNMANCILKLINDKDLCQNFSRAGIEMALTQITDQTTAEFTAEKIQLHLS
jgi:glycosyltransferase involved in cell wall biosynthesis